MIRPLIYVFIICTEISILKKNIFPELPVLT